MPRGASREASQAPAQIAADAVVGEEMRPEAASPEQGAPRVSSSHPASTLHAYLMRT